MYSLCYFDDNNEVEYLAPEGYFHDIIFSDSTYECNGCWLDGKSHEGSYYRRGNSLVLSSFLTDQFKSEINLIEKNDTLFFNGQIIRSRELLMLVENGVVLDTIISKWIIGTGRGGRPYHGYENNCVILSQKVDSVQLYCKQGDTDYELAISNKIFLNKEKGDTVWLKDDLEYVPHSFDEYRVRLKKNYIEIRGFPFCK